MTQRDETDLKISKLLKEQQAMPHDNEWFTRKVLNRLPPRYVVAGKWIPVATCAACLLACLAGWAMFIFTRTPGVILVRDVVGVAILLASTTAVLYRMLRSILQISEA